MVPRDFSSTLTAQLRPDEVFAAVCDVRSWWEGDIQGDSRSLGAQFTYRQLPYHESTQKVVEFEPGRQLVWLVTDSKLHFVAQHDEWTGTRIIIELTPQPTGTLVRFTHAGLVPELECYGACSQAWSFILSEGLARRLAPAGATRDARKR